jgi:UDP-N-acetylglucosamine 2-epimerase (non-hydrolysing)
MKIAFIIGTRPEIIKCAPVILKCREEGHQALVVFTGQHREMGLPLLRTWGIEPDIDLEAMRAGQSLTQLSSLLLEKMHQKLAGIDLDAVAVQGDTTSAFIGSYWAFLNKVPVAHIEAGLRTNDLLSPFPEEGNRQLIGRLSRWHFPPTEAAKEALLNEGVSPESIVVTGNTSIDALLMVDSISEKIAPLNQDLTSFISHFPRFILLTGHRRENLDGGLERVFSAVETLAKNNPEIGIVFPVHLNPVVKTLASKLEGRKNIWMGDPLDYFHFVGLLKKASLILTDSGGVQEEGPSFGAPVLVFREKTERPEGIASGHSILVGTDTQKIIQTAQLALDGALPKPVGKNPYGDGQACLRIIQKINQDLVGGINS